MSRKQGCECDIPKNLKRIKSTVKKVTKHLKNLLPKECFVICYIDEDDTYQFITGEMSLDEVLAMRSYIDMEMQEACSAQIIEE